MRKDVCKHVCLFSSCTTFALLLLCYYCHFSLRIIRRLVNIYMTALKHATNREYWFWHSLTRNICTSNLTFSTIAGTLYFLKTGLVHPFLQSVKQRTQQKTMIATLRISTAFSLVFQAMAIVSISCVSLFPYFVLVLFCWHSVIMSGGKQRCFYSLVARNHSLCRRKCQGFTH